jgi:hypothetical protein
LVNTKQQQTSPQEVAQSVETTLNEVDVTSSNLLPPSCVDMSKKKKKNKPNYKTDKKG